MSLALDKPTETDALYASADEEPASLERFFSESHFSKKCDPERRIGLVNGKPIRNRTISIFRNLKIPRALRELSIDSPASA
jgi:hypothetical protein